MSMHVQLSQMQQNWQHLSSGWQRTVEVWQDDQRWIFEAEFWMPLHRDVPLILMKMERVAQVVADAQRSVRCG